MCHGLEHVNQFKRDKYIRMMRTECDNDLGQFVVRFAVGVHIEGTGIGQKWLEVIIFTLDQGSHSYSGAENDPL